MTNQAIKKAPHELGDTIKHIAENSLELLATIPGATIATTNTATFGVKALQDAIKEQGLHQITVEFQNKKLAGMIDENFIDSNLGRACLLELLKAIDNDPDPERIQAMKNAFIRIASQPGKDYCAIYQQQILRIIGTLSSGEIVLLAAIYRVGGTNQHNDALRWKNDMARETGFLSEELVELTETPLIEKRLIHRRTLADNSGIRWGNRNRLTRLGEDVCESMKEPG